MSLPFTDMPEPPRRAALGHLPEWVGLENATRVLDRMVRYADVCGPVARISLGPVRMVVIADPDVAAAALADPRANHKGASYVLTRVVLDNVLLLNGEAWERHRAVYRKALRNVDAVSAAKDVSARFAEGLAARGTGAIELDREILRLVGNVVGSFIAGVTITEALEPHRHRVQYELAAVGIDLLCQPWTFLSPARWWKLRGSVRRARRFFEDAVRARLASPAPDARDVLGGFLALAKEGAYPGDVASIAEGVVNFFFTAHDVLASSALFTLHLLARHPAAQTRLRAALAGPDGDLELERVVKEGLRLFPGYGLFGRTTRAEMDIGGYLVPRGTILIASPFVSHRRAQAFERPMEFDPDRWRTRPSGTPPAAAKGGYMPFGAGSRACLASHLAFPVLETIVREIVTRVELRADPTHDPGLVYWGTSYPRHGMPVQVVPVSASPTVLATASAS